MKLPSMDQAQGVLMLAAGAAVAYVVWRAYRAASHPIDTANEAVGVDIDECCKAVANDDRSGAIVHCQGNNWPVIRWILGGAKPTDCGKTTSHGATGTWLDAPLVDSNLQSGFGEKQITAVAGIRG